MFCGMVGYCLLRVYDLFGVVEEFLLWIRDAFGISSVGQSSHANSFRIDMITSMSKGFL